MLQRGHSDGCDLASTLCKYDLRRFVCSGLGKGAMSEAGKYLLMGGGSVRIILLLSLMASCMETIDVHI